MTFDRRCAIVAGLIDTGVKPDKLATRAAVVVVDHVLTTALVRDEVSDTHGSLFVRICVSSW